MRECPTSRVPTPSSIGPLGKKKERKEKKEKTYKNKNKLYYIVQANNPTHPAARTLPGRPWPVRPKVKWTERAWTKEKEKKTKKKRGQKIDPDGVQKEIEIT